jgi:predicted GNAT family acetyltransferase
VQPEVVDNPQLERFELRLGDEVAGFVTYRFGDAGRRITLVHTEIEPGHEGAGLGSTLARGVLDDARRRGLEVVPRCPFIAGFIARHAGEYLDLVVPALRAEVAGAA